MKECMLIDIDAIPPYKDGMAKSTKILKEDDIPVIILIDDVDFKMSEVIEFFGFEPDLIYSRYPGDIGSPDVVKKDLYSKFVKDHYHVRMLLTNIKTKTFDWDEELEMCKDYCISYIFN